MKKLFLSTLLSLMAFTTHAQSTLVGDVNNDGKVTVADAMMVVNIIMNGYTPISVSQTAVFFGVGETTTIDIEGGFNQYQVTSSNTAVVTATLNGSVIILTAIRVGTATITLTDVGQAVTIKVTVEKYQLASLCPDDHHPHLIDLGLPSGTKWACCNVDATTPEDYGGYYAWGETETKTTYELSNYTHYDSILGIYLNLGSDIAGTEYDVAHMKWGDSWVMPSQSQQEELIRNCSFEQTRFKGTFGNIITGSNGCSIFLPGAGMRWNDLTLDIGILYYWSSTQCPSESGFAYSLMDSYKPDIAGWSNERGQSVRPVVSEEMDFIPLQLSSSTLNLSLGEQGIVEIISGNGSYRAESSDAEVANAVVDGTSVKVTALSSGTATITVTDVGRTAIIKVTVEKYQAASLCPDEHHPHQIDLGLPSGTKWACCNVDDDTSKQSPTNYGSYYAWGETETKTKYDWSTYTQYDGSSSSCHDLGSDIAGTQYDVAHMKWGDNWVMPSKEQQDELRLYCYQEWVMENRVEGRKFISITNGSSIFLPAAGDLYNSDLYNDGSFGFYWSSTPHPSRKNNAYDLLFNSDTSDWYDEERRVGHPVRPVVSN